MTSVNLLISPSLRTPGYLSGSTLLLEFASFPDPSQVHLISTLLLVAAKANVLCFHQSSGWWRRVKSHFRMWRTSLLFAVAMETWSKFGDRDDFSAETCNLRSTTGSIFRCLGHSWGCGARQGVLDRSGVWGDKGIRIQAAAFPLWGSVSRCLVDKALGSRPAPVSVASCARGVLEPLSSLRRGRWDR